METNVPVSETACRHRDLAHNLLTGGGGVRQRGSVCPASGGNKPAHVYELIQEAEGLFPKAYEPGLCRLFTPS